MKIFDQTLIEGHLGFGKAQLFDRDLAHANTNFRQRISGIGNRHWSSHLS